MAEIKKDLYISISLLLFSIFFIYQTIEMPDTAAFFPMVILSCLLIFSFLLLVTSSIKFVKKKNTENDEKLREKVNYKTILIIVTLIFYTMTQEWFGFLLTTFVSFNIIIFLSGYPVKRKYFGLITSLIFTIIVFTIFNNGLNIPLERGVFFN